MHIKELQISNVLSFAYYEKIEDAPRLTFDPKLNILIGENGAGKSTALEVLNFLFKKVLFKEFFFNSDILVNIKNLQISDRRQALTNPSNKIFGSFRIDENWNSSDKPQNIRLRIELDEIDKKNIKNIAQNVERLNSISIAFSTIGFPAFTDLEIKDSAFVVDVLMSKAKQSLQVEIQKSEASEIVRSYLENYHFFKYLIEIHNHQNPDNPIENLFESFALISSYRNFSSFNPNVNLSSQSGIQQIQGILRTSYSFSLNSIDQNEPSIFNIVRLQIADAHFALLPTGKNEKECEDIANNTPFLIQINQKLQLIGLKCSIRLVSQRTWLYSFEFKDIKRNKTVDSIDALSAGQKAIIHLIFEAYGRGNLKGGVVIIDEPEIHLHYQFQHEYLRIIETLNTEQSCQYILVTHSEALINSNTIHNVKRFALDEQKSTKIVSPIISSDQKTLIKILDNTRATYAFFGKKVVLVEGDSDRYFFKSALNEFAPSLTQEISVLDIGGKGNLQQWRTFFELFSLKVYYIGDFDNVFSLKLPDVPMINPSNYEKIESELKQEQLDKVSEKQRVDLSNKISSVNFEKLIFQTLKYIKDSITNILKIEKQEITGRTRIAFPSIDTDIESKYSENIFILKSGALEAYTQMPSKQLPDIIKFANEKMNYFIHNEDTNEATEIRNILKRIIL